MKLVALCLLAVCCSSLADATTTVRLQIRKLKEVQKELSDVKDAVLKSDKMFNAPPQDIKDGCCLSALECFRNNLTNAADKPQRKLLKSLRNPLTESALTFCSSGNNSTCQPCGAAPMVDGREFFNRLETLIQMGLSNLSMN